MEQQTVAMAQYSQALQAVQAEASRGFDAINVTLVQSTVQQPMYSERAAKAAEQASTPSKATPANKSRTSSSHNGDESTNRLRDGRAVTINMAASKTDKKDYAAIKSSLQQGLDGYNVTKGLRILYLRPSVADRIDVIFETEEQATKGSQHQRWATSTNPGTTHNGV